MNLLIFSHLFLSMQDKTIHYRYLNLKWKRFWIGLHNSAPIGLPCVLCIVSCGTACLQALAASRAVQYQSRR